MMLGGGRPLPNGRRPSLPYYVAWLPAGHLRRLSFLLTNYSKSRSIRYPTVLPGIRRIAASGARNKKIPHREGAGIRHSLERKRPPERGGDARGGNSVQEIGPNGQSDFLSFRTPAVQFFIGHIPGQVCQSTPAGMSASLPVRCRNR